MPRDILLAEIGRMEAVKQALCAVIERVRPEMYTAYSAIPDAVEVQEAREQLGTDIGMLSQLHGAIIREIDIQIARMRQMISMDPDAQQLPLWLRDMSLEAGAGDADAAQNDQIARDAQYAAELVDDERQDEECPICLSAPAGCVLPCGHRICFECIVSVVQATPVVGGEQHVPCPICRITFSNEGDIHTLQDFRGRVYAQLPKQGIPAMQRLLLKL